MSANIVEKVLTPLSFDKVSIICIFIYLSLEAFIALSRIYYQRNLDAFTFELIGKDYYSSKNWFWFVTYYLKNHWRKVLLFGIPSLLFVIGSWFYYIF